MTSRFGGVTRLCRGCRLPLLAGETGRCAHCDPPAAPTADVMVCVDCPPPGAPPRHRSLRLLSGAGPAVRGVLVTAGAEDPRFSMALIVDVFAVLEAHGYRLPAAEEEADRARGGAVGALSRVVRAYEGGPWAVPDA